MSDTHLLSVQAGHVIMSTLCEEDGENSMWATAGLVHISSSNSP